MALEEVHELCACWALFLTASLGVVLALPRVVVPWNRLPGEVAESLSLEAFEYRVAPRDVVSDMAGRDGLVVAHDDPTALFLLRSPLQATPAPTARPTSASAAALRAPRAAAWSAPGPPATATSLSCSCRSATTAPRATCAPVRRASAVSAARRRARGGCDGRVAGRCVTGRRGVPLAAVRWGCGTVVLATRVGNSLCRGAVLYA